MIVTIARENGSGGRDVGKKLADMLGIKCYDQEIIAETAKIAGIDPAKVIDGEEKAKRTNVFFGGIPASNPIFAAQSEVIKALAEKGSCVFVGRCADYVLRDCGDVLRVFIHAPIEVRTARSAERNNITEKEAFVRVRDTDRERALYYQRHTGIVWGIVQNYNLSIDTGAIGIDNAAKLIIEYIRMSGYEI